MADENTQPIWERQESDTLKSWEAFVIYRDMGASRSLQKAADEYYGGTGVKRGHFEGWSVKHNWVARCEAYDAYQYEQHQERKRDLQLEAEETLVKDWRVVRKLIKKKLDDYEKGNLSIPSVELRDLIKMLKEADDMIRRTAGLPDRISENKTDLTSGGQKITWRDIVQDALGDNSDSTNT